MIILHLMKDYKPTIGGSVVRNSNMIENYLKQSPNDKVMIVNLDGEKFDEKSNENGIEVYRSKTLLDLIKISKKLVKNEKVDIIQAHNFRFLFAAFLTRLLSRRNPRIYVEIHAMYHMSWYKELLSRWFLKRVDGIVVLAECAKKYLIEAYKLNSNKITVIRNGIDLYLEKAEIKDKELLDGINRLKESYSIVLYTGSFIEWQGVNFIADEFDYLLSNIPEIALVMIGNGPDYDYVEKQLSKSKYKDRVLLHHGISKQEIMATYGLADVLLIPRLKNLSTNTAVPLKVIEAMEYGKCIVSANDNGLKEVLNSSNSYLFESGDIDSLINELKSSIVDNEKSIKIAKKAEMDAKNQFVTWEDCTAKMIQLYKRG